ncbi:hypothetical protein [Naasia aerilata]|uniref:DUF2178 domain-containing protein n=1 Tax=Naasia aerilata TaxID=1162966 RepID=A0ABM8G8B4_9MICO|nr:hypothetical protein [Naasia aerilata]BDZ44378.1 hypothetical protein GCM10025866_02870 [Naasia aerilata]
MAKDQTRTARRVEKLLLGLGILGSVTAVTGLVLGTAWVFRGEVQGYLTLIMGLLLGVLGPGMVWLSRIARIQRTTGSSPEGVAAEIERFARKAPLSRIAAWSWVLIPAYALAAAGVMLLVHGLQPIPLGLAALSVLLLIGGIRGFRRARLTSSAPKGDL